MFVLGILTLTAAAYAPRSATMARLSRETAHVTPCSTSIAFRSEETTKAAYPVPSEDVIARAHSAAAWK
jgi:hypothetical protein